MEQEESAYITSLHLKGYKSIRDVSVTLNKGLNILIGANGSGKTNFLEFLDAANRGDYSVLLNGRKFEINFEGKFLSKNITSEKLFGNEFKGVAYRVIEKSTFFFDKGVITCFFDEDNKLINKEIDGNSQFQFHARSFSDSTLLLKFENPMNTILKEKLSLNFLYTYLSDIDVDSDEKTGEGHYVEGYFIESSLINKTDTFLKRIFNYREKVYFKSFNINDILKSFKEKTWVINDDMKRNLQQFSPIKDIKVDWQLSRQIITKDSNESIALIEGIDFQFYVNNEWLNWKQLSDGTKRLFYLIGSVTYAKKNDIILIEEPELGVHPHQLALLMNFLMSKSAHNQIIISTHSPQVLNSLGEDELDNIIVARHEGKEGTKMYHLSEEERGYATEYMKNVGFLSDYWMMSGFMQEENPEYL